jgi:tetratricopeptide (TPR) repeat protein
LNELGLVKGPGQPKEALKTFIATYGKAIPLSLLIVAFILGAGYFLNQRPTAAKPVVAGWDDGQQGYNAYRWGRYSEAVKFLESAVAKDPLSEVLWYDLGNSYFKLQKYPEAVKAYQRALFLKPGDADAKANLEMAKKHLKPDNPGQEPSQQGHFQLL